MESEQLKLHLGIIQRVAFSLLKVSRLVQHLIGYLFWKIVAEPLVFFAWLAGGRNGSHKVKHITFYKHKLLSYNYGLALEKIINFNAIVNGNKQSFIAYDFLLRWNPAIPLIALEHEKSTYSINRLGDKVDEKEDWYNLIESTWLGVSKNCGHFIITSKEASNTDSEVTIKCVWLSGKHCGECFAVSKSLYSPKNIREQATPHVIYFPPKFIVTDLLPIN